MQQQKIRAEIFFGSCERSRGIIGRGGALPSNGRRRGASTFSLAAEDHGPPLSWSDEPRLPVAAANARFREIRDRETAFAIVVIKDEEPGLCTADARLPTGNRRIR
jgi:hypothetical protein